MTGEGFAPTDLALEISSPSAYFEDLPVGCYFVGGERVISEDDLRGFAAISGDRHALHVDPDYAATTRFGRPLVHGPFGQAAFLGWLYESGLGARVEALLTMEWEYRLPMHVGERIHFEMTITRARWTSAGTHGIVRRHIEVRDDEGELVQVGTSDALITARHPRAQPPSDTTFGTPGWAAAMRPLLGGNTEFREATATWDGSIGIRSGRDEVQIRIYCGEVIATGRMTPKGPTFVLGADERTWTDLLHGERNDFMGRAIAGGFEIRGDAYEYLRLTRAVVALVDSARDLARKEEA